MEQQVVSGIAYSRDEAKVTLVQGARPAGVAAGIFEAAPTGATPPINVDMIVQNVGGDSARPPS